MRQEFDVLVVGLGITGIYATWKAREAGLSVLSLESGKSVGGTWYWNRYPGARCDVESLDYSFSFDDELQREWRWSENYAGQPEILRYLEHVTDRHGLRPHMRFEEKVTTATQEHGRWTVTTESGLTVRARFVVLATGGLSTPLLPDIPGLADFEGQVVLTAQWPHEGVDFAGKRVGVIGTGASALQAVPIIAKTAKSLHVFQRTANFSIPVNLQRYTDGQYEELIEGYAKRREVSWKSAAGTPHVGNPGDPLTMEPEERNGIFERRWQSGGVLFAKTFNQQLVDMRANDLAREFVEAKIRDLVEDAAVAEDLIPTDHPIGAKRICSDSGYYATFNQPHVSLVNLRRDPIVGVEADAVRTKDARHELDILVFATGFDAMTGALARMEVEGPRGDTAAELWSEGPLTYLGVSVPGLPNLFTLNGAGTPSVLTNMMLGAEQQVNWTIGLIEYCGAQGWDEVEPRRDAARMWTDHVTELGGKSIFARARSWYRGLNVEGKTEAFLPYSGGFDAYQRACDKVVENGYEGFVFGRSRHLDEAAPGGPA